MLKRKFGLGLGLGGGGGVLGSGGKYIQGGGTSQGYFGSSRKNLSFAGPRAGGGMLGGGIQQSKLFSRLDEIEGGGMFGLPVSWGDKERSDRSRRLGQEFDITKGSGGSLFYDEADEEARLTLGGGGGYSEEELGGYMRARGKRGPGFHNFAGKFKQEGTFVRDRKTGKIRRATVDDPLIDIMGVGGGGLNQAENATKGGGLFNQLLRNEFEVDSSIYADRTAEAARKFGLGRGSTQSGSGGGVFTPKPEGESPFDFSSKGSVINPDYDFKAAGIDLMAGAQWRSREDIENFISSLRKLPGLAGKKSEKADTERDKIRKLVGGRRATTQTRRERIRGLAKEDEVLLGKL